ncbi:ANR family transcriptional regulator [Serratia ureilytica]|uniref:ANR family transcriptional regulator n=1 Tax=Serratia ureilytica TaxID=300181 RepID=UPI00313B8E23
MKQRDDELISAPDVLLSPAAQERLAVRYATYTQQAAALERAGLFEDAAALWHAGRAYAPAEAARLWCETRETLCRHRAYAPLPPRRS